MAVRKPEPLPRDYIEAYFRNWKCKLYKTQPDRSLMSRCVGCKERGVLGYDLIHRGDPRPTNLLCDKCFKEDNDDIAAQTPTRRSTVGRKGRVQVRRP